jgi:D-arabinose 1-dehydrogenase-like Zn-dependent alcohol dehydrogenase
MAARPRPDAQNHLGAAKRLQSLGGVGSGDKAELAKKLGAHHYIDSGKTVAETFKGLRPGDVSIVLGVGLEPIVVSTIDLIFGSRKLEGALTGDPATGDETLRFSALSGVSAMIETAALEQAAAVERQPKTGQRERHASAAAAVTVAVVIRISPPGQ